DDQYLLCLTEDGRQFSLIVSAPPAGVTGQDVSQLSAEAKEQFLTQLARAGDFGAAAWQSDAPGYALFSAQSGAQTALPYSCLSLSTLYLGKVYTLHMEIINRDVTQDDAQLLVDASNRLLRLGAASARETADAGETAALALPQSALPSAEEATLGFVGGDMKLALDPVPAVIGTTTLSISGVTQPKASLRYSVNDVASSRFKADAEGRFTANLPNLQDGVENDVTLSVWSGDSKNAVSFKVKVEWQSTPVALSRTGGTVEGDSVTLSGLTLPGAKVTLLRGSSSTNVKVAQDGSFTCTVKLSRVGENTATLRALADGYRRVDTALAFTRVVSAQEEMTALQKKVSSIAYAKLVLKPSSYKDKTVALSGTAEALAYENGQPRFNLRTGQDELYSVHCADLLSVREGEAVSLIGTLNGQVNAFGPVVDLAVLTEGEVAK
ncbi:MAG: hypothetical protein PHY12_15125, partial [Eubacteriales bacterium]|nr:hypothetical protein [Eubacteriales bacterium]